MHNTTNSTYTITQLTDESQIPQAVEIIRASFRTIIEQFRLDESNCPSHPAFITGDKLKASMDDGMVCFILRRDNRQIGFVRMKKLNSSEYSLERLAVLPEERHNGCGRMLVDHVCTIARNAGGHEIHIGIINEHTVLKHWYQDLGFVVSSIDQYDHLPFGVCMMRKMLV